MKLDIPKAIIIGALIVAAGFFFNSMYERQLAYNICMKMFKNDPIKQFPYNKKSVREKMCKWHVYVLDRNNNNFMLPFKP